jgi:hypothetical protein
MMAHHHQVYLQTLVLSFMICISLSFPSSTLQLRPRQRWQTKEFASNRHNSSHRDVPTVIHAYQKQNGPDDEKSSTISNVLIKHGFGRRLIALTNLSERPMPCELFANGSWRLCLIVGIKPANDEKKPPLLEIKVLDGKWEPKVVDIGEIILPLFVTVSAHEHQLSILTIFQCHPTRSINNNLA